MRDSSRYDERLSFFGIKIVSNTIGLLLFRFSRRIYLAVDNSRSTSAQDPKIKSQFSYFPLSAFTLRSFCEINLVIKDVPFSRKINDPHSVIETGKRISNTISTSSKCFKLASPSSSVDHLLSSSDSSCSLSIVRKGFTDKTFDSTLFCYFPSPFKIFLTFDCSQRARHGKSSHSSSNHLRALFWFNFSSTWLISLGLHGIVYAQNLCRPQKFSANWILQIKDLISQHCNVS